MTFSRIIENATKDKNFNESLSFLIMRCLEINLIPFFSDKAYRLIFLRKLYRNDKSIKYKTLFLLTKLLTSLPKDLSLKGFDHTLLGKQLSHSINQSQLDIAASNMTFPAKTLQLTTL